MSKKYYQLVQNPDQTAELYIYGEITGCPYQENDVSAYSLTRELQHLDAERITVYLNSYGGEVAEATAIYNQLRNHHAHITTVCDGFACSAASVIFMAGEERLMNRVSRLMIHNAMTGVYGNGIALRKAADDLDSINELSVTAYLDHVTIPQSELQALMDRETWLKPEEAVRMGFATGILEDTPVQHPAQSALPAVCAALDAVAFSTVSTTVSTFLNALSVQKG